MPSLIHTNYSLVMASVQKMLPVWRASGALFPSVYMSAAASNDSARQHRIRSTVELSVATAELVAGGKGRPRLPVYPFAWEAYHNGSTLLTHADAIIDFLSPFNSGADGLVIWGSTRTSDRTGKAVFPAQGGPNTQTYFDYVRTSTGPLIAGFQAKLLSCSKARCSGHGRCTAVHPTGRALAHDEIPCACFDGFSGDHCEEQQQLPPPTKTDDAMDAVTVATAPPHVDPMAC